MLGASVTESVGCPRCDAPMELRFSRKGDPFWGCPRFPACRGSRDYVLPDVESQGARSRKHAGHQPSSRLNARRTSRRSTLAQGTLVRSRDNDLGVGKVLRADTKIATIEYFDAPGQQPEERHTEDCERSAVMPHDLVSETRVFWEEGEAGWRSGRVDYQTPDGYVAVRVRDGMRMLAPVDLYVRWDRPLRDPTRYARVGLFESPHNYERRAPVLHGISQQLRATRGMAGLLSVAAELHLHQLAAARRVLDDHTQRYLLADEVGLGKTVEALLILRQLLVDDPALTAQLIVPDHLQGQWQAEVDEKLLPKHFPWAEIRICGHSEWESWDEAGVVVVDEAHGLVRSSRTDRLRQVAHGSPRLLLLSATPALHNEEQFLGMLHLLDPVVYPRDGLAALRARVEARRDLGRALVGLVPDAPAFALSGSLAALRSTLQGEGELLNLLDDVEAATDPAERAAAIRDLRGAVADVFQVHRRMIRNRRTDDLVDRFPVSRRHGTSVLQLNRDSWQLPMQVLEGIAEAAEAQRDRAIDTLAEAMDAFPDVPAMLRTIEGSEVEIGDVHGAEESVDDLARELADALTYEVGRNDRTVVFAPTARLAHALSAELRELLGPCVATIVADAPPSQIRSILEGFAARGGRWLVCDASAQEGVNLQMADLMVHFGLPGRVDAIEQRIGRVDRWTDRGEAGTAWRSLTVVPPIGLAQRWATVVDEGFGVHTTSLASLQRAVEETSRDALRALSDATTGIDEVIETVQRRLDDEREAVREQDAIDEVTMDAEERDAVIATLEVDQSAEQPDGGFAVAFGALMTDETGNLRFIRAGNPVHGVGRFEFNDPSSTRNGLLPLVPLRRLRTDFVGIKEHGYAGKRAIALTRGVSPIRIGSPIVDVVHNFLRHDDRGRAWGLWRHDPTYEGATEVWWRVDILVRPAIADIPAGADRAVLQRTLDGALPPTTTSLWVRASDAVELVEDVPKEVLGPYQKTPSGSDGYVDRHLRPTRLAALERVIRRPLDELVDAVRQEALGAAMSATPLVESQRAAVAQLEARARRRTATLRRRQAANTAEQEILDEEVRLIDVMLKHSIDAVREPRVTIDAIGVIVLSSEWPWDDDQ